jgi:predicted nucleotidyltransferase component of viral defense system
MLSLDEIKKAYPEHLQRFQRFLLREYLQHKILEILFQSKFASKLSFIGGTCLRIVHRNTRFSEDLDFDNFDLSENDFIAIASLIHNELKAEGYEIEIKNAFAGAYHCYIRFPGLLFQSGLSGYKEEKILIQLDTEAQGFHFQSEPIILNRFDVFTNILVTPIDILLSQKFYAICNRQRHKGRDFFDIVFLLSKTKPNYEDLRLKIGTSGPVELKAKILSVCEKINFKEMAEDVQAFLFDPKEVSRVLLFREYIKQFEF